jgi:hypothetical protein
VCADIPDFRGMAENEDMAIRFYEAGDPNDLAEQIVTILESPALERQMAEHNFAAGVEMTMTSVVGNYLRWFELNRRKMAISRGRGIPAQRPLPNPVGRRRASTDWSLPMMFLAQNGDELSNRDPIE